MLYTAHTHGVAVWCFRFSFSLSQKFFLVHGKEYWRNEGDEDERKRIIHTTTTNFWYYFLYNHTHSRHTHAHEKGKWERDFSQHACRPTTPFHIFFPPFSPILALISYIYRSLISPKIYIIIFPCTLFPRNHTIPKKREKREKLLRGKNIREKGNQLLSDTWMCVYVCSSSITIIIVIILMWNNSSGRYSFYLQAHVFVCAYKII